MGIFIGWLIISFLVGLAGSNRKIGFAGAFFCSLILSPIIGLIITLFSASIAAEKYKNELLQATKEIRNSKLDAPEEIEKLYNLWQKGIITEEEYNKKKNQILS